MFDFNAQPKQKVFKAYGSIKSVADIIENQLPAYGNRCVLRFDRGDTYSSLNFDEYLNYLKAMVQYFTSQNIEQKVIGTFCKNRLEWDMVGMASFYRANALFPLDTKTNPVELEYLLKLNSPDYMLVARPQLQKIRQLKEKLKLKTKIIVADLMNVFEDIGFEDESCLEEELSVAKIFSEYDMRQPVEKSQKLEDPNVILGHYPTSGTTSLPKIVAISHGNIISEVNEAIDVINLRHNEDLLNIGPYTHIATLVEFLVTKTRGFCTTYFTREPDDDDVLEDEIKKLKAQGVRIKALMAVPKFWIYLMKEVLEEMKNKPVLNELYQHLISIEKK